MTARGDAGFTLVELLIALSLLGMLTVLAYGAVQFVNLSWRQASAFRDADADRAAIRRLLGRSIQTAYPAFASATYADRRIEFDGESGALRLIAPLPEALTPGIMAVERFEVGGADHAGLTMAWNLDLEAATGGPLPAKTVTISSSVARIRFAYFGRIKDDEPPAWFDQWADMERLPEMVRVRVWRQGVHGEPWLDFTVATGTTTNTACVYDLESPICRRLE